jgi:hypothetical protein
MDETGNSTRRSFLRGGVLIAAPLAIAVPGVASAADGRDARLRRLEDEAAIRALHQDWVRRVNGREDAAALFVDAGAARCLDDAVCGIVVDAVEPGAIEIVADGRRATGHFLCTVETESRLAPENIFARMALAQGGGITRESARHEVCADYVKVGGRWMIAKIEIGTA